MKEKILFLVSMGHIWNSHVITYAFTRDEAKRSAHQWLGGDLDLYKVTPLTNQGDRIHLDITLYV